MREITSQWPDAMSSFINHPDIMDIPNGENFPEVQARAMKRLNEIIALHEGQTIVITAHHGAVLRTILTAALHMRCNIFGAFVSSIQPLTLSRYDQDANPTIELLNGNSHLGELR